MPSRRVAIVGARIHGRRDLVEGLVASLPDDAVVISGRAAGVDSWAETAARARGLAVSSHAPDYDVHGARAPLVRNGAIVADATEVHAFPWWGCSGTYDTIAKARAAGLPLTVYKPETRLEVLTTRLGSRDPCELDITRGTAWRREKAANGWPDRDPKKILRDTYRSAFELGEAGRSILDIQRASQHQPSLGEPWAPSAGLLHRGLEARKAAALLVSTSKPGTKARAAALEAQEQAWASYELAFIAEMKERYRATELAWGWLLAQPRVVLACTCTDATHCHRTIVARMLGKHGANVRGELAR